MIQIARASTTALLFSVIFALAPHAEDPQLESMLGDYIETIRHVEPIVLAREGENLKEAQIAPIKEQVLRQPNNSAARARLLGYYRKKGNLTPAERQDRNLLVFSVIRQQSDSQLAGSAYCAIDPRTDPTAYQRAAELWLQQVRQKPNVLPVLRNAGDFLSLARPADAEQIYRKAGERQPESPEWPEKIGFILLLQAGRAETTADRKTLATKSLAAYRDALALTPPAERFSILDGAARAAYLAGDTAEAEKLSLELLELSNSRIADPDYGYAIHQAHTILGLIALRNGNKTNALDRLADAGQVPFSEKMNILGPATDLAAALFKAGERDAVERYLVQVRPLWRNGAETIDGWVAGIREGSEPVEWSAAQ